MNETAGLQLRDVGVSQGKHPVLSGVNAGVPPGSLTAVVGPNGCGKSTLLQAVAGLHPHTGTIDVGGQPLLWYPRRERVHQLAYVEQAGLAETSIEVRGIVELGRLAGQGLFVQPDREDRRLVDRAMADADVAGISDRRYPTLSGGERQRTHVARALAQDAAVLVLDEPTNHLDLNHQHQLMQLLGHLAHEGHHGGSVLLALHDLGLAARYCDEIIVLHRGGIAAAGPPAEVLSSELLAEVFGIRGQLHTSPQGTLMLECIGPV
ncbi:ABC transporter ATP-binding protein [Corynebacterium sp. A21]|uniref:ABC transporter ATP-binding protein n=1 Tax=Corynebacterium sp. A21 TaxID=3457318 RepID=UPI003FD2DBBA